MSITNNDLLIYAEKLLSEDGTEVIYRSIARLSYYSSFHLCHKVSKIIKSSYSPKVSQGIHEEVCQILQKMVLKGDDKSIVMAIRSSGHILALMKSMRVHADYKLDNDFSLKDAQTMISQAKKIKEKISMIDAQ